MSIVLIIEDEINTAQPVQEWLKLEDIESDIAADGETGVQMFREKKYDLVLLDLKLPKMDGESVLKEIRKINPYIDVLVYTNFSDFADIKALTNIGIDGYINKGPTSDLEELIDKIKRLLDPLDEEQMQVLLEQTPSDFFER